MGREIELGQNVLDQFPVWNSDGYTKKSGETVFTKRIWKDGVASSVPVTVSEIGATGEYLISFTPDSTGVWLVEITINFNKEVWQGEYVILKPEITVNASMSDNGTTAIFGIWFDHGGQRMTDLDSVSVVIKDTNGTLVVNLGTSTSDTPDGVFKFSTASGNLATLTAYTAIATAVRGSSTWIGQAGFTKV